MTIGELSRKTGLAPSAIRYYEAERLIPAPARRSGRRVFDDVALEHIAVVQLARDAGFSLAEIRRLVNEFGRNRWRALAERKLGELRDASRRLRVMATVLERLIDCHCPDVEFCGRTIRHRCAEAAARPRARTSRIPDRAESRRAARPPALRAPRTTRTGSDRRAR
ncbi:MAG: MerR family transcriptional regulator [Acidobacteria bacterium]|nr:MerR family transcriptional regulator [Acidobacteriota bacterium]MCA1609292.1 MerR family transcriptional regulator [Acidobacteriota bacterium]